MSYRIQHMREHAARQEARPEELPPGVEVHINMLSDVAAVWIVGEEYRPGDGERFISVRKQLRDKIQKLVLETRA